MISEALHSVMAYHQATKHHFHRYAQGPHHLDWANQPDPFRRYEGAPLLPLDRIPPAELPLFEPVFVEGLLPPQPLNRATVSRLFYDSLAISAWKQMGEVRWALRVNPSSGNLHPTEGYLICGAIAGLCEAPLVAHYAPREHALERRAGFSQRLWERLTAGLPDESILVGLTSIHWREAWKYGERAYRYCQHDAGHAMAAVALAAAALGWKAVLLDTLATDEVGRLLGVDDQTGIEAEHPDAVLAVFPGRERCDSVRLPEEVLEAFAALPWEGKPNRLSRAHVEWPTIDAVAAETRKPRSVRTEERWRSSGPALNIGTAPIAFRSIVHQRRSAVALDGRTGITKEAFMQILWKVLPGPDQIPFNALPWRPSIHLVFFVHRVQDIEPGLYLLVRDPARQEALAAAMRKDFAWQRLDPPDEGLPLYRLLTGDARKVAGQIACHQEIAADGCFALGMLAEFEEPLHRYGPWFYPRLFWETGMIGQVLYLEAEASGIRGTGIGCFFDDPMHELLGLEGMAYQDLYHFTMGGAVEDPRLSTLPAYPP